MSTNYSGETFFKNAKFYKLSLFINHYKYFDLYSKRIYDVLKHLSCKYPDFYNWYWNTQISRVIQGNGDIIFCIINSKIVGVANLKKDKKEVKLCTLFVSKNYRKSHIGTILVEKSFIYLGTTKPLITIPDYKIVLFKNIIDKYEWKCTQILDKGYYNKSCREFVYNGFIY